MSHKTQLLYDCNNYGNNNDNLDRTMNQSCSDFRIRNRTWTWIKNMALLIKVCVVNHPRVYLVHNFYYLGTMKFSFSLFLSFCIYLFIHQFINLGYFILFFFRFSPSYPVLTWNFTRAMLYGSIAFWYQSPLLKL